MVKRRLLAIATWIALFCIYTVFLTLYPLACLVGCFFRRSRAGRSPNERRLLLIGTFYTRNWCIAHLTPLSRAENVASVVAVVDGPTHPIDKVEYVYPPQWMVRLVGRAFAKLYCALRMALRDKPDLVMGYHLLPGGMTALLVARIVGAASGYQLTAGPIELIGGGAATENFFLKNLGNESWLLERLACLIAGRFDLLVTRGGKGRRFLLERGLGRYVRVIPGSLRPERFRADGSPRTFDVISVCRLVPIKQPDHQLEILARLHKTRPNLRAAVVGDGPLRASLEQQAERLGITNNVMFFGEIEDVERQLARSKIFLLTSRSEGLSIAMAEAMACGAIPVVADVGDLADLVKNDDTGWLAPPGDFDAYAEHIDDILSDAEKLERMSAAATRRAIQHNGVDSVARRWARTIAATCMRPPRAQTFSLHWPWSGVRRRVWERTPRSVRRLAEPIAAKLPQRSWLGRSFRRELETLERAQWWSADKLQAHQLERVRTICQHAYERTMYYHDSFNAAGFDPYRIRALADLAKVPTITADDIRDNLGDMCTVRPDASGIELVTTGGTGGAPLRFLIGRDRSSFEYAHLVASWQRAGYTLGHGQAVLRGTAVARDPDGLRHEYDPILRRHYYSNFHMSDDDVERYLTHIATIGPCYLHVYPSSVLTLARYLRRSETRPPENIIGILAGSEGVHPEEREMVEGALGMRYFSWYGHTEKVVIAAECEHSPDYHVWPTYGFFELLDEKGQPVTTSGQRGEIVGTGFVNNAVPFIRYRTGDLATYVGDHCEACGRAFPIIRDIKGHRERELLVASDGTLISWTAINMHDRTFDNVRQFQFRQHAPGSATLRLVPSDGFGPADRARILTNLRRKLNGQLDIEIELTSQIELTARGKSIYVDQRVDLDRLPQLRTASV